MKYPPCGGVRGARFSMKELQRANDAIDAMRQAKELDKSLSGQTVVVAGNSATLNHKAWKTLNQFPIIGCNRGLLRPDINYSHLVIADREPYCQERDAGRLEAFAKKGGKLLLSDSLFQPDVLLRGPPKNPNRRAQPTPDFEAYVYQIGTLGKKNAQAKHAAAELKGRALQEGFVVNLDTFRYRLDSCWNVAGSMIQAAGIMAATKIIFVGLELKWESEKRSHFYGSGRSVGAYPQNEATVEYILLCLREAKRRLELRGVELVNLSPVKNCPFASVFGNGSL